MHLACGKATPKLHSRRYNHAYEITAAVPVQLPVIRKYSEKEMEDIQPTNTPALTMLKPYSRYPIQDCKIQGKERQQARACTCKRQLLRSLSITSLPGPYSTPLQFAHS